MGSDPAPFFDFYYYYYYYYHYYYKSKWIKKIENTDIRRTRILINTFRFINRFTSLNYGDECESDMWYKHRRFFFEIWVLKLEIIVFHKLL